MQWRSLITVSVSLPVQVLVSSCSSWSCSGRRLFTESVCDFLLLCSLVCPSGEHVYSLCFRTAARPIGSRGVCAVPCWGEQLSTLDLISPRVAMLCQAWFQVRNCFPSSKLLLSPGLCTNCRQRTLLLQCCTSAQNSVFDIDVSATKIWTLCIRRE